MEENVKNFENQELGSVKISEEVVSIIAGLAATEVPGVAGMSGGVVNGISEILGRKNLSKGVKVEVGDKEATIDLYLIVDYGVRIPEVAWNVQENVKNAVENMTGLKVVEVNIHVQGVSMEKENKKQQEAAEKEGEN
ncbi:Asp23/Gls24 family envelope stress response protein [Caldanaerobacter subterraneus]|uniref:Asp23/Gls24 family envelope stress response protein n=1 Tax=Caldanaerobacter subterraneus TaxID=911092 RepID=A0A7Y2PLL2_9THEO|nr:Asp23/Gls24 family envelope stress response protein [Caldanaerobacter subterraneus]NNG66775.1 Asp23/Gls24 family envelope stress response protein [Caldanaerobacter subterraneus]